MKKFISLALTVAMVVAMVPATAFASSDNRITGSITGETDQDLDLGEAPVLVLRNDDDDWNQDPMTFELTLENAEWKYTTTDDKLWLENEIKFSGAASGAHATVEKKTDKTAIITVRGVANQPGCEIRVPMLVKLTGGAATVTVVPKQSNLSSDTLTFARGSSGGTITSIEKETNFSDGDVVKDIFIEEVAKGAIDPVGSPHKQFITVKLSSGFKFKWDADKAPKVQLISGDTSVTAAIETGSGSVEDSRKDDQFKLYIDSKTAKASQIKISNLHIFEDGANFGDVAYITVSGAGVEKEKLNVGTYTDFGTKLTAEDKELPIIYSGREDSSKDSEAEDALKVTFEESIVDSWITSRKTEFKLPEGVKFGAVEVKKADNIVGGISHVQDKIESAIAKDAGSSFSFVKDDIEVTDLKKAKIEVIFSITAAADFTGDIDLTVTGPGVSNEELSATIATAVAPFTVTSKTNEVSIDYRNVAVNDIVITEAEAGLFEKDSTLVLKAENMKFEDTIEYSVDGDLKIDSIDVKDSASDKNTSIIKIKFDSSSSKPSTITLKNVQLFLDRTLPAGSYKLSAVPLKASTNNSDIGYLGANRKDVDAEMFFKNYNDDNKTYDDADTVGFDVDDVVMIKEFVKVVTAGRDQGDSTFTTKIVVPIGANEITAGDKKIALDAPAYITGAGWTMLPVRAVTEALSGVAVVRWDDATKTATISFGQRIISMTVGKLTMNINGVETPLQAAPEITNERIFLPLRDLGYALGLNDSKIAWDAATSTATLN